MFTIYHNPRCAKSRETLEILKETGDEITVVEYLKSIPTEEEFKSILKKLGASAEDIVRKEENLFKEKFRDKKLSEAEWLKVLTENPVLIQRPIVIKDDKAVIGRPPTNVKEIL